MKKKPQGELAERRRLFLCRKGTTTNGRCCPRVTISIFGRNHRIGSANTISCHRHVYVCLKVNKREVSLLYYVTRFVEKRWHATQRVLDMRLGLWREDSIWHSLKTLGKLSTRFYLVFGPMADISNRAKVLCSSRPNRCG
jgi:hypothetical protein